MVKKSISYSSVTKREFDKEKVTSKWKYLGSCNSYVLFSQHKSSSIQSFKIRESQ